MRARLHPSTSSSGSSSSSTMVTQGSPCHSAGVQEHAFFMKEITDAVELRRRIQEVFELAALPGAFGQR